MRYVSIDTETTGLNHNTDLVLEFAAVIDDTEHPEVPLEALPQLRLVLYQTEIVGHPTALAMNHSLILEISKAAREKQLPPHMIYPRSFGKAVCDFLVEHKHNPRNVVAAGKNFAKYDLRFLEKTNLFDYVSFHYRSLDPMPWFTDPRDLCPPSLEILKSRAGLPGGVSHTALEDALDVVRLIRIGIKRNETPSPS